MAHSDVFMSVYFVILELQQGLTVTHLSGFVRSSRERFLLPLPVFSFIFCSVGMHTDPDESSQLHHTYRQRCAFLDDTAPVSQHITLRFDRQSSGWKRSDTTPQTYLPLTAAVPRAAVLITETMEATVKWELRLSERQFTPHGEAD